MEAKITTSPDGSYKITSPLTSAEIGCSHYMQSLSSDSSREDVAKAMMLSLASIEHLRKISPDKMTSSLYEKITSEEQTKGSEIESHLPDRRRIVRTPRGRQVITVDRSHNDHKALKPHTDIYNN